MDSQDIDLRPTPPKLTRRALLVRGAIVAAAGLSSNLSLASSKAGTAARGSIRSAVSRTARVGGIPIYYEIHGGPLTADQTPFVLMHGGLMTIETAFAQDLLPKLSALAPTIAIESQGHGHTTDRPGPMELDQLIADLIGVMDHARVPSAHLVGHSLGALVAVEAAIRRPERVKSLTSLSGVFNLDGQVRHRDRPISTRGTL